MTELDKNIKRKYFLSEYNPNWVNQFDEIRKSLVVVFGNKALKIEHVGSTSIPGMKAKPLIDILVIVEKVDDLEEEKNKMVNAGYEWGADYIATNTLIFFKMGLSGEKLENIHVCEEGAPKARQFLVMRDFFIAFPEKAKQYSDIKTESFDKFPDDYPAYRKAKAPFLEQMEQEAYRWDESR